VRFNFACKRFQKLWNEQDGRILSRSEQSFLDTHRAACPDCAEFEHSTDDAMQLLRSAALEPEVSVGFDDRVVRKVKVQSVRESIGYWSPALIGAGIACVAVIATLQIAATPVQLKSATLPAGEAKRDADHDRPIPNLILEEKPNLDQ
jgi:hypothetical protein